MREGADKGKLNENDGGCSNMAKARGDAEEEERRFRLYEPWWRVAVDGRCVWVRKKVRCDQ